MTTLIETKELQQYLPEEKQREITTDLTNVQQHSKDLAVKDQDTMDEANNRITWIVARQKGLEAMRVFILSVSAA